ncbi:DUF5684 domain-containing protein [Streptococcus sp. CSL10205-OR2]|uniref:DUF5684 domain-containing protein n=1 Tax=Streptococcus sp. CSL10205-OR2 TaxID=2980558 RepID=UPI0021D90884|nr:DUF5684 domain-containing protein [Streptococcus sp. CSL10205-OR2]MCU9534043.1 DUF5684 domain-containing protein [Streptococcus sp. CSL10205-OR2]
MIEELKNLPAFVEKLPLIIEQLGQIPDQIRDIILEFEEFAALLYTGLIIVLLYILLSLLFLNILTLIGAWRTFEKANEPGWKVLIPIYNLYILSKIIYGNGWQFVLLLIPVINIYYSIRFSLDMAKSYGKSTAFGIGIFLLSPLFISIIGYGASEYQGVQREMLLIRK